MAPALFAGARFGDRFFLFGVLFTGVSSSLCNEHILDCVIRILQILLELLIYIDSKPFDLVFRVVQIIMS